MNKGGLRSIVQGAARLGGWLSVPPPCTEGVYDPPQQVMPLFNRAGPGA